MINVMNNKKKTPDSGGEQGTGFRVAGIIPQPP
jgi:hypothetical protein